MKRYFRFLAVLALLLSAGYIFLVRTVMPQYIRQILPEAERVASSFINGSVSIGDLAWDGGLSAEVGDIRIKDARGGKVADIPRLVVHLRPWLALDKTARAVSRIELLRPQVYLSMDSKEEWNMSDLLKPSDSEETPFYGLLEISKGQLHVSMPQGEWSFPVSGTIDGGANPRFALGLRVGSNADELSVGGLVTTKGEGRLELKSEQLDLAPYAALAQHYASLGELQGGLKKLALVYVNEKGKQRYSGQAEASDLRAKLAVGGNLHSLKLDGALRAHDNYLTIRKLNAVLDGQELALEGEADLRDLEAPSAKGVLTAAKLAYAGYAGENLRLPFKFAHKELTIENAEAGYGGGSVRANAAYSMEEKVLAADVELEKITHALSDNPQNDVHISAKLAVLAKILQEGVEMHAATQLLDCRWRGLEIKELAFAGALRDDGLAIDHFSALAGEQGVLLASGKIGKQGELEIKGRMADFPVHPLLAAAGRDGSGVCSTAFALGGQLDAPEFGGVIQLAQAEFMEQKIQEAHGFVSLKDNLLTVKDFRANMEQGWHILNGMLDLRGEKPYFDLALETSGVRIEPLMRLLLNAEDVPVTGNLDNIVQARGTLDDISLYGEVHASDGSAMQQLYNSVDGRYAYDKGKLTLKDFLVKAFYADLKLDGTLYEDGRLDFAMLAKDVDLAHLPIKDETVDLGGKLNAQGHLGGTLTAPAFRGDVASERVLINGEALTELSGTIDGRGAAENLFQVSFKQPYKDDPDNYGLYTADVNLNLREKFMQGKVQMLWGDIGGLLRMARMDYDINGQMDGLLDFCPEGKGSGLNISITADDVKIHSLNYAHMILKGNIKKTLLTLDDARLQEEDGVFDRGLITVGGQVELARQDLALKLESLKANPAIVTAVMKDPPEIKGEMDMRMSLNGTLADPRGGGSLEISNGSVEGVSMDKLDAELSLDNGIMHLRKLTATKDAYGVRASGEIPLDLFRVKEQRRNPQAQMDIVMNLDEARLGILPALTEWVEWGAGDTAGQVRLAGTLEEPLLYGSLKIDDGSLKIKYLDSVLEKINLDVAFEGNSVLLRNFSTSIGKGRLTIDGSYALQTTEDAAYRLHINASDVELASQIFSGRINSDVEIIPQKYFERPQGGARPAAAYRPLLKGWLKPEDVVVNMPTIPEMGEGESNLGLDLQIALGKKIHLYNSYLYDIWLKGGINIKGSTRFPVIDGSIKADKGTISYLRTDFKLRDAGLVWVEPGTFLPNVNLESTARFSRYRIFMRVTGPVEKMDLQLTSDPPLERNTIVRMLTLQRDTAGSNEVTGEDMNNLMTAGLQMTVLGDVETWIKQTLGLDQFRVYTGKVRSGIGFESSKDRNQDLTEDERNQYNVLVSKYLNNNFMFGYTTSFDALEKSVFGQYDLGRHMNVTYSRRYDLNSQDTWYGLEYKISF